MKVLAWLGVMVMWAARTTAAAPGASAAPTNARLDELIAEGTSACE